MQKHLLGIEKLTPNEINTILDLAERYAVSNRERKAIIKPLLGYTQINIFFENSTRTQTSFEIAGKRLGADVMNIHVDSTSIHKGETLLDTAMNLNAMQPGRRQRGGRGPDVAREGSGRSAQGREQPQLGLGGNLRQGA
mgnify:CR=1 FL=1